MNPFIEEPNTNDEIGEFYKLSNLLGGIERDKGTECGSRDDTLETSSDLLLNIKLCRLIIDVIETRFGSRLDHQLFVLIQKEVEDLLEEDGETFKILGILDL